ncbi:Kiwa anti-phage protein KwaB-like domain-containing protein [Allobaculum stercoricanis]|uniref:Kiwa anti-phage protein KwaB-like domain-containing protein n=1 Tax=Allobaculum stercoricanis TaxID=174709 RepID=UPI0023F1DD09|nr:Kiwa anti-phage protein KwaB-like domain-containing protein [Allobaculum stercoricanis]
MSISKIKSVFENVATCDAWSLQLLQIKNSKRNGTTYCGREIALSPEGTLTNFLTEISDRYCSQEKGLEKMFESVTDYDGSTVDKTIYKLTTDNELISTEYPSFVEAIGNPDSEVDPLKFSAQAYLLKGVISICGEELSIKMISMQNPVTSLKHKFLRSNGTFTEISDKVISLRTAIDVVIIENTVYMLTLAGENLFNMERAYKSVCEKQITNITDSNIINDAEAFRSIASCGHNPRKFVSFNESHLQKLKNANNRKKMSKKFNIPLDGDKFDMSQPGAADKLVKLLCDRGMVDPFDDNPMEVSSSKKWE